MQALKQQIKLIVFRLFRSRYKKRLLGAGQNQLEFRFLSAFLKEHPLLFIDVGANKGEFLYLAEKILAPGKIVAFEPLPWFAKKLEALFSGITVFNLALSDKDSETTLYLPVKSGVPDDSLASVTKPVEGEFISYPVKLKKLDDLAGNNRFNEHAFLKIDVEGHEFAVLKGANNFIRDKVQFMLIEIEERHHAGRKLVDMIQEIETSGFVCYYLHPESKKLVPFSENPAVFQKKEDLNTPFYINNFWFFTKQLPHKTVVTTLNKTIT